MERAEQPEDSPILALLGVVRMLLFSLALKYVLTVIHAFPMLLPVANGSYLHFVLGQMSLEIQMSHSMSAIHSNVCLKGPKTPKLNVRLGALVWVFADGLYSSTLSTRSPPSLT